MSEDKLCFVRIPHPRGEHGIDCDSFKDWNRNRSHKRKFLRTRGAYVGGDGKKKNGEILFWGEWEPQSTVEKIEKCDLVKDGPKFIHKPYWKYAKCVDLQNTDPFVFGSNFRCARCQQRGQLKCLKKESVILFGSTIKDDFVLDTVLVVRDSREYNIGFKKTLAKLAMSEKERKTYGYVVMRPIFSGMGKDPSCGKATHGLRKLYSGVTFEERAKMHGMFSFFPCKPYQEDQKGFARPVIELEEFSDKQKRNYQVKLHEINEVSGLWNQVKKKVLKDGLMLGIFAELPERKQTEQCSEHVNSANLANVRSV